MEASKAQSSGVSAGFALPPARVRARQCMPMIGSDDQRIGIFLACNSAPRQTAIHVRVASMFTNKPTSRRQFLRHAGAAAGLAAVPLARPARAQSKLRDVTFRLDWIYQGPHAGFLVAQD